MEDVNNPENRGKIALVNGGAMDYLMNTYLGADSTMASRTSLVQGWDQAFTDFFEEETTLYDAATGPAGGVAKRVWDKINVMSPYFGRYPLPNEFDDLTGQDILDTVGFMLSDAGELLLSPLSSASQLNRYIQMRNWNRLIDKRGGVVAGGATEEQFSVGTQIAALMGAKPNVLDEKYSLQEINRNTEKFIEYNTNQIMYSFTRYMREVAAASRAERPIDPAIIERHRLIVDVIEAGIGDVNIRKKVRKRYAERVRRWGAGEDQLSRQQNEFFQNYLHELADEISSANIKVTPTR